MGCVFGRPSSSPPAAAARKGRRKKRSSPMPAPSTDSPAADQSPGRGRPRRRLGRKPGPRQGCVPAPAAAEQLAAGWPPWLVAVAGEALRGWTPRRADTFEKLNKVLCGKHPRKSANFDPPLVTYHTSTDFAVSWWWPSLSGN